MKKLVINGGRRLFGKVKISSAKNACLPLISATLAFGGEVRLKNTPNIADIDVMCGLAKGFGCLCERFGDDLYINAKNVGYSEPNSGDFKKIRASLFFLGSLLARFKKAVVFKPGGCDIGARPIDIHLSGLSALGARFDEFDDKYVFYGDDMHSGEVFLRYPSVGATINLIESALFLDGKTIIKNAAKEPEILCLCDFLNVCGFKIYGGGSDSVIVFGVKKPDPSNVVFTPIFDRIEAATFMSAVCACGGEISLITEPCGVKRMVEALRNAGGCFKQVTLCKRSPNKKTSGAYENASELIIKSRGLLHAISAEANVYPALATDMQPLLSAALIKADGRSVITDKVYPERFSYADELVKLGAKISRFNGGICIDGVKKLTGADLTVCDLRGGAALAIAALASDGESVICGAEKICRGYADFDKKLSLLGARAEYFN